MIKENSIIKGDCLDVMKDIDDKSIDMILCDLPYQVTNLSWDYLIPFDKLWAEYRRIIKDNCAIVLTASQPFTSKVVMSNLEWFRHSWIWEKEQGTNQNLKDISPMKIHEDILVFGRGRVKYNPIMRNVKQKRAKRNAVRDQITGTNFEKFNYDNHGLMYPTSIIYCQRELTNRIHPTQKPVALFEYLVKTYSDKNDIVLDNTAGSMTTAIACYNTNRKYICIEMDKDIFESGKKRVEENERNLFLPLP
jgi:site-specific DNA-methyltransferase (adenine-specific)